MWRVGSLVVAILFVAIAAIGEVRPPARPQQMPDGSVPIRPLPRPAEEDRTLDIFRPKARPDRTTAKILMTAATRPTLRPASLVIQAALPIPDQTDPPPRPGAAPVPVRQADIVMVGDSITAGGRWAAHFPGVRIANRGVSGDTSLNILARMDGILATKPKRALLMFGINDIYNGVPVGRIVQRYERIVTILTARGIEVVIQSTLECSGSACGKKLAHVHALNARLQGLAASRGLRFVDINVALSDRGGLKSTYSRDGVHLNGAGYARWYAVVRPYFAGA